MKHWILIFLLSGLTISTIAQDWEGIPVPASPGEGMVWELQADVSDNFNYNFSPTSSVATIGNKWTNFYHNAWSGPKPTVWKRDHIFVQDGKMKVISSRSSGEFVTVNGQQLAATNLGCATSVKRVQYPVYIEAYVKVMNSVSASNVWLLSPDDTQEIDICEAYGHDTRWNNPWFNNERVHLSHHVFIRSPFTDWQPSDEGSFYTDGMTVWNQNYHRFGVYWRDPWHLEYYVDGKLVRVRSGKDQIDPVYHTNSVNPGDTNNDTRTGLSKPMDIIINTEDQSWRAVQGLTPTDQELADTEANTFNVDWIRVYKPAEGEVGEVTSVSLDQTEVNTFVGDEFILTPMVKPNNANDLSVTWSSDDEAIASVDENGLVKCHAEGTATITVTTNENSKTATCVVNVSGEIVAASLVFDDEDFYLNTEYSVGGALEVSCEVHAGSGNTIVEGGQGGVKFWLREIKPGWAVANDYTVSDASVIGEESGTATGIISLEEVPATAEIPAENWYFLFVNFSTSDGSSLDKGIWPINIVRSTNTKAIKKNKALKIFPNPVQSVLNIEGIKAKSAYQVQIISAAGQIVKVFDFDRNDSTLQLDISQLPKGNYLVKALAEETYVAAFVKD
ncbi:MAG: Ig-like domain-containing protein [Bacteroidota bacterium]